jgi:hypothetical protein
MDDNNLNLDKVNDMKINKSERYICSDPHK